MEDITKNRSVLQIQADQRGSETCVLLIGDRVLRNHRIMSYSRADPVLGLNILQGRLGVIKYLNQCLCPGWEYLNIQFSVTALRLGVF